MKLNLCHLSEGRVAVPWETPLDRGPASREEESGGEEQFCGAPECNTRWQTLHNNSITCVSFRCGEGEFCANTGVMCRDYPCCQSSQCVTFPS